MDLTPEPERSKVARLPNRASLAIALERQVETRHPSVQDAVQVLEVEATAMRSLAEAIAGSGAAAFGATVDLLHGCRGRVIVTGMGKSGLVARKIAATLASTGTPSHFVHPAEASHGDLGMIAADDVVLALSKSGETPELADLLSYTRSLRIPLVAMTSRPVSSLARDADLLLLLPSAPEACPLGCAPTTSTTLMVALGDALAVALMRCKSFTPNDFRLRHPGGRLGRRLMRVENLLHGGRIMPLVHVDAPMSEVVLEMTRTGYGSTGVIDDHGLLVGAIHDGDVRRHMGPDLLALRAGEIMSGVAVEIRPDMLACDAFGLMSALGLVTAIVTEGARPVGILHVDDCRRAALG